MGWANCGTDSEGHPIGYAHEAECDHPGCDRRIDRGLSYACGGMHGEDVSYCEKYFCGDHLIHCPHHDWWVCEECCRINCEADD